ncbi:hypothetical protein ACGFXC_36110 [Streptomyces sp. NPDC048507]|uniref:hypothetical protein n=1 Tax=Streptomyces sp. NPDC048507 TaxID=3365560 RepID=UPI003717F514
MVVIVLLLVAALPLMPFGLDRWEHFLFPHDAPPPRNSVAAPSSPVQPLHPGSDGSP